MPRRLVRDFLARDTVLKAEPEETVRDAAIGMAAHHCGSVLVARGDVLVGIFTERDLLARVVAAGRDLDTRLLEVMTANPDTIAADAPPRHRGGGAGAGGPPVARRAHLVAAIARGGRCARD